MAKFQKPVNGNCIFSFLNKLMEYYGLTVLMNFLPCPDENGPVLRTLRSGSH
jgi:hypothetical protein